MAQSQTANADATEFAVQNKLGLACGRFDKKACTLQDKATGASVAGETVNCYQRSGGAASAIAPDAATTPPTEVAPGDDAPPKTGKAKPTTPIDPRKD
jgi:hypothetical protein